MRDERFENLNVPDEVDLLTQRFLEETLSDREGEIFLQMLNEDPLLRRRLKEHVRLDSLLREFCPSETVDTVEEKFQEPTNLFDDRLALEKNPEALRELVDRMVPVTLPETVFSESVPEAQSVKLHSNSKGKSKPKDKSYRFAWISAVLLVITFGIAIYQEFRSPAIRLEQRFVGVATIAEAIEAEWEDGAEVFKSGQELEPSVLKLRSGVVKIRFADGAEVVLEGPAEFLIKTKKRGFCQRGNISAFVPPEAVGFTVDSPTARIVDLGTAFSMQVSSEASDVHVLSGKVELVSSSEEKTQIHQGSAARADLRSGLSKIILDPLTYFSSQLLEERKTIYFNKRQVVWERQFHQLRSDPSLCYHLLPENHSNLSHTTGNRDDNKAIRFRHSRDRIDASPARECRSLTLLASVRLRNMRNAANTLVMGDEFYTTAGAMHWQINRFGVLQFHISDGKSAVMFDSEAAVRREDIGTWITLALVADGENKTITHYFEGRRVSTTPWNGPTPIRLDHVTLGNESSGSRKASIRFFNGDMEDFWIFNRPFSAAEIEEFHHNIQ